MDFFIMENLGKMDDLGETHYFRKHPKENVPFFSCFEVVNKLNSAQVESLSAAAPLVAAGEQLLVPTVPRRATSNEWEKMKQPVTHAMERH